MKVTSLLVILVLALLLAACLPGKTMVTSMPLTPTPSPRHPPSLFHASPRATNTFQPVIRLAFATPTPGHTFCVAQTGNDVLNVRVAPSLKGGIVGALLPGEKVEVWGPSNTEWLYIITDKIDGWVSSKYCEVTK